MRPAWRIHGQYLCAASISSGVLNIRYVTRNFLKNEDLCQYLNYFWKRANIAICYAF
jgi:hypothetical protein